ncbi:endo-1,4-beta-xylanase [Streptomyces sp. 4N509B]|uniref:endo-1,4-beta-xylanase n=1 Tax=Streptomyces sp. 4N509B TaxID=3457413 RepID=UPI003FD626C3
MSRPIRPRVVPPPTRRAPARNARVLIARVLIARARIARAVVATAVAVVAALPLAAPGVATAAPEPAPGPVAQEPTLREAAAASGRVAGVRAQGALLADPAYQVVAGTEFGGVDPGEEAAWDVVNPGLGRHDFSRPDRVASLARAHEQPLHGFPLLRHDRLPAWLSQSGLTDDQLRQAVTDHLHTVTSRYAGQVGRWDVVVNPLTDAGQLRDTPLLRRLGSSYLAESFRAVDAADPNAPLYLAETGAGDVGVKGDALYELAAELVAAGVPLDGVALQLTVAPGEVPAGLARTLQRFADLGLAVAITGLAVPVTLTDGEPTDGALEQQARDYAAVVEHCVAQPACTEVSVGGVTDEPDSWLPPGTRSSDYLFDQDYAPKPAYGAARDAFL